MHSIIKISIISVAFSLNFASAQTDPSSNQVRQLQPAAAIAGEWSGNVDTSIESETNPQRNNTTQGQIEGTIQPSGQIDFNSSMGCKFNGFVVNMLTSIRGTVKATECSAPEFNKIYQVAAFNTNEGLKIGFVNFSIDNKTAKKDFLRFTSFLIKQ